MGLPSTYYPGTLPVIYKIPDIGMLRLFLLVKEQKEEERGSDLVCDIERFQALLYFRDIILYANDHTPKDCQAFLKTLQSFLKTLLVLALSVLHFNFTSFCTELVISGCPCHIILKQGVPVITV